MVNLEIFWVVIMVQKVAPVSKSLETTYRYRQSMMEKGSTDINVGRWEICKLIVGLSDKCNINIQCYMSAYMGCVHGMANCIIEKSNY